MLFLIAVYFKVAHHKKGTYVEDLKKYMAYFLEQHFKEHMGEHIAVVFDFSGAGLLNMVSGSLYCNLANTIEGSV